MHSDKVPFKEVEDFVRWLVALGGIYTTDEEGYVIRKNDDDDEPVLLKVGNSYKRLLVLQERTSDNEAVIINPFNESSSETPDGKWLYNTLAVGLAYRMQRIITHCREVIEHSDDQNVEFDPFITKFCSKHRDLSEKVQEYFLVISKNLLEFSSVFYVRKLKEARFRCSIFDPDLRTKFPGVTKKAWKVLVSMFSEILEIDPENADEELREKYFSYSDSLKVPKLDAMLKTYSKVYQRLNRYLSTIDTEDPDLIPDLTTLAEYISKLEIYYDRAHWFAGHVTETPAQTQQTGGIQDTSSIPNNVRVTPTPAGSGYAEPESNIPSNTAREGIEYASQMPKHHCHTGHMNQPSPFGQQVPIGGFGQQNQFGGGGGNIPIR